MRRLITKSIELVPWKWRAEVKRLPAVAPLQRWLLSSFLEGREFVHRVDAGPARGLNYPIMLPQDKGIWTGTYELSFSERLAAAVRPGDICLDIGGWRGFYSGVMALAGAKRVYIFEPLPANGAHIRRLIELNPALPLQLFPGAVGEAPGKIQFEVMPQSSMGKLTSSPFQQEQHGSHRIDVDLLALDDLLARGKIQPPAVIKMDIEGAEALALRGARQILSQHKPKLFIEIHSHELARECAAVLREHGYEIEVLETAQSPDFETEPEVCHFAAFPLRDKPTPQSRNARHRQAGVDVPILLYHHVVEHDQPNGRWYEISLRQFEDQLDAIQAGGFTTVSLHKLLRVLRGEEAAPDRMLVITFDDGFRSFRELALPALHARAMTATMFVPAGMIGATNCWDTGRDFPERTLMTAEEIREIMESGIEVGAHGWIHRNLTLCSEAEAREEIFRPYQEMTRCFGTSPQFFAYPYGQCPPLFYPLLEEAGYEGALSIFSNERTVTVNRFNMRRIYVHTGDTPLRFRVKLSRPYLRYKAWRGHPSSCS